MPYAICAWLPTDSSGFTVLETYVSKIDYPSKTVSALVLGHDHSPPSKLEFHLLCASKIYVKEVSQELAQHIFLVSSSRDIAEKIAERLRKL